MIASAIVSETRKGNLEMALPWVVLLVLQFLQPGISESSLRS